MQIHVYYWILVFSSFFDCGTDTAIMSKRRIEDYFMKNSVKKSKVVEEETAPNVPANPEIIEIENNNNEPAIKDIVEKKIQQNWLKDNSFLR